MYEELKLFPKAFNGDQESLQHGRSQSWYIGTLQASPGESWYIVHSAMYELSQCTNRIWYMAMYNVPYKDPCLNFEARPAVGVKPVSYTHLRAHET